MKVAAHPVAAEDLMALMDGELAAEEARVVSAHLQECAECALLMREFRGVSESLAGWTVEDAAPAMDEAVMAAGKAMPVQRAARSGGYVDLNFWKWNPWAIRSGAAVAVLLILLAVGLSIRSVSLSHQARMMTFFTAPEGSPPPMPQLESRARKSEPVQADSLSAPSSTANSYDAPGGGQAADSISGKDVEEYKKLASSAVAAQPFSGVGQKADRFKGDIASLDANAAQGLPMIARTVSLTLVVKDVPEARAALERVLARYGGYAAQLTVNTPEGGARSFQASLRVPAAEVAAALAEVRALGRVENESQAGEEVTQQHADLVARLQNSRETEQRLKDILAQRTGKIEDVLQVEEEIARVRGEIEGMEGEQKTLEHRVDFASVDLQMSEVYREQLGTPSASVGTQVRNAFVSGLRRAGAMMLGLVLFAEEAGPAVLIWVVILGAPGFVVWRRYRKIRAQI